MIKICLLTLNEVKGCIEFFENRDLTHKNVFAVDGGSKDGTIEFLEDQGVKVINQEKRNYNGAYKLAFNEVGPDDCIIFFHPKQTIDSKIIIKIECELKNYDFIVASRMLPQSVNEEDIKLFRPRKWFNGALSLLAYSVWGNLRHQIRITDPLHGIRGLSYKFISELKFNDFGVDADLAMVRHAYKENFTTLEVPVVETQREYGKTHFPAFRTGKSLILYIFRNFI